MTAVVPRVRMIAGPNGSGKSTVKTLLRPELLGTYVNPDELEAGIRRHGWVDLRSFGISASREEVLAFFVPPRC